MVESIFKLLQNSVQNLKHVLCFFATKAVKIFTGRHLVARKSLYQLPKIHIWRNCKPSVNHYILLVLSNEESGDRHICGVYTIHNYQIPEIYGHLLADPFQSRNI